MIFEKLVALALPNLVEQVKRQLLASLKKALGKSVDEKIALAYAAQLGKDIRAVSRTAVKELGDADARKLKDAYRDDQAGDLAEAAAAYRVYADARFDADLALERHGEQSMEAKAAQEAARVALAGVKREFREALEA